MRREGEFVCCYECGFAGGLSGRDCRGGYCVLSLPAVAGVVSSAVLAGGVAADVAPLAGEETITVGVIILSE